MNEKPNTTMLLRRRFCKRVFLMSCVFALSFYISLLLFGDLRTPKVMHLTNLNRCPTCFGVTVCHELYSNQLFLETNAWTNIFNAKNIYYGYTKTNRKIVLKKLAHDWEFNEFDSTLCQRWKLKKNCKPSDLLNVTNVEDKIIDIVQYNLTWPDDEPRKGLVMCPNAFSFYDLVQSMLNKQSTNYKSELIYIWTMLMINPEPIIIQVLQKSKGWPVPTYGGVCGRLEVVAYEGQPLSSLTHVEWQRKLKHAKKILDAAMDFTFKHDRFRFYLMDWSIDNIVANTDDRITFIDLEDVVVLDKHILPRRDLPDWYQRYARENIDSGFTFSIENMCKHHLSDHNIWAACYVLANEETGYLYPIPKEVYTSRPHFERLLSECLNGDDRIRTVTKLQQVISDMLADEKIVTYGVR